MWGLGQDQVGDMKKLKYFSRMCEARVTYLGTDPAN